VEITQLLLEVVQPQVLQATAVLQVERLAQVVQPLLEI
jgi:hypothetical protein